MNYSLGQIRNPIATRTKDSSVKWIQIITFTAKIRIQKTQFRFLHYVFRWVCFLWMVVCSINFSIALRKTNIFVELKRVVYQITCVMTSVSMWVWIGVGSSLITLLVIAVVWICTKLNLLTFIRYRFCLIKLNMFCGWILGSLIFEGVKTLKKRQI